MADRLAEFAGFAIVTIITLTFFSLPFPFSAPAISITATLLVAVAAVVLWLAGRIDAAHASALSRKINGLARSVAVAARTALRTVGSRRFGAAVSVTTMAWIAQIVAFSLCARAAGVTVPLAGTLSAIVAISMGSVVRTTPGNVGVFQFLYALAVVPFGVVRADAIAVGVLIQAIQIAVGVSAAALCLPWTARSLMKGDRSREVPG